MRIKQLTLRDFGPFKRYKISFGDEEEVCLLLTGRNNEGKSSLINALKLLNAATRVINKKKQEIRIEGDCYYKLLQQDTEHLLIGRFIHNYSDNIAQVTGSFQNRFIINVYLNPHENIIYSDFDGPIPADVQSIFGFIPPLGLISENEDIITHLAYLKASIDTSLSPRHLRNHFYQILSDDEFDLVKHIIKKSWSGIELLNYEIDQQQGKVYCYYKEDRVDREISWAGQGLQVWFQIITHLVRLRNASILILDEPEINLHPEKQNDLIRILKDYYQGSIIIATHSVELMNNVSVSHIINVQKKHSEPKLKSTDDRMFLNRVRSQIGSNFNLIASQFEDFDLIVFTEDSSDFKLIQMIGEAYKLKCRAFNIPIHGFSEYRKCLPFKDAYSLLIGKSINYTAVLDKDYYPEDYLIKVKDNLESAGIRVVYTPGKEIENIFLFPKLLSELIPETITHEFLAMWDQIFASLRLECYGSFLGFHKHYLDSRIDMKTITTLYTPVFESCWNNLNRRHLIVDGKEVLKILRGFYQRIYKTSLSQTILIEKLVNINDDSIKLFIEEIYHIKEPGIQILHY